MLAQKRERSRGPPIANGKGMSAVPMRFVYVLQSMRNPDKHYVGRTSDVAQRLAAHNSGGSIHTALHRPWQLNVVIQFRTEELAINFEKFLKSGTGRGLAKAYF